MKIIQIITSSKCWAGMEQYAFDLSSEMINQGHQVVFVIANDGDVVYPRFETIGKVYLLPLKSKFDFKSSKELRKIINREQPDIIHTHQPKNIFNAYWAAKHNKNVKIVHTVHFVINPTSPQALYSWIFKKVSKIITVSNLVRDRFLEVYPEVSPERVVTVLNSVNASRFVIQSAPPESSVVTLGYAGRLVEEKGVEVLLKAAHTLNQEGIPFELVMAGTGGDAYVDKLKAMISEMGLDERVEFMGFVKDMNEYLNRIDIAIIPSICKEAIGLIALESMVSGKAIIATNNGGVVEIIDHGKNGILVNPGDDTAIADSVRKLIQNPGMLADMRKAAQEKFDKELSYTRFIDRITETYQSAISGD